MQSMIRTIQQLSALRPRVTAPVRKMVMFR